MSEHPERARRGGVEGSPMPRFALLALAVVTSACGPRFDAEQYPTPESLYDAAMVAFRSGDCGGALTAFQRLQFELSADDQRQAEVRYYLAECTLQQGQRLEAARQFRRVSDEFPQHPLAGDALLRAGDAYTELWGHPELDPTYGETALATYTELIAQFPGTLAAARGQLRIAELNDLFAEKDYRNGIFYLRLRAFDSAIIYFRDVVARFPSSGVAAQSVLRLVEIYDRIGYEEERELMCDHLRRYYADAAAGADRCGDAAAGG
jgi:outer membrane assembly lipoprotein YfiO